MPREALVAHYRELLSVGDPPSDGAELDPAPAEIACCALDLKLVELRGDLLPLFDGGWIDETIAGARDEVAAEFAAPRTRPPVEPFTDVVEAARRWGCFERKPRPARMPLPPPKALRAAGENLDDAVPKPFRAPPQVGRNDPGPCGSGKKYKKCRGQ